MRLSVVVPAYNEERRWPAAWAGLQSALAPFGGDCEILVVDDGSRDGTADAVRRDAGKDPRLALLSLPRNAGRGAAVREGVMRARGDLILELDADGSVDPEAIGRFVRFLDDHPGVDAVIGSRRLPGSVVARRQPLLRVALGWCFVLLCKAAIDRTVSDFTLGFKMFRREAAREIFPRTRTDGFAAEAELVFAAIREGRRVCELPVRWTDYVGDSRVRPLRDAWRSLKTLRDMRAASAPREAEARLTRLYAGLGWPSVFTRIRLWTAPYRRLEPLIPREGVILDLGTGYGTFANLLGLLAPGRRCVGLELDRAKAAVADRGVANASFSLENAVEAPLPEADAILLIHVLHHLRSREEQTLLLRRCLAALKPGGRLVICEVDRRPAWKFALAHLADWILYPGDPILYRLPEDLTALLAAEGFSSELLRVDEGTPFSHVAYVCARK